MISLKPVERIIRAALIEKASILSSDPLSQCLTYKEMGKVFDPEGGFAHTHPMSVQPFRGLGEALGHVSMYEVEHGRPMLSALVVRQGEGHPGSGFAELGRHLGLRVDDEQAFWEQQVREVVEFWSDTDPTRILDASFERMVRELASIKALLRR